MQRIAADRPTAPEPIWWTREERERLFGLGLTYSKVEWLDGVPWAHYDNGEIAPARWSREAYYRMAEAGLFDDRRVELIDGEIFEMAAMKGPHAQAVEMAREVIRPTLPPGLRLRQQTPVTLGWSSDPEPDAVVFADGDAHPETGHPARPLWIMEIADTSLDHDRRRKMPRYAASRIPVYWLLDLNSRTLSVYSEPTAEGYAEIAVYAEGESVSLPWPSEAIHVAALLA
jgi:Uma2 family endonuclease